MKITTIAIALLGASLIAAPVYATAATTAPAADQATKNQQVGEAFLEKNKTKSGVTALPDGLQYKVIKAGQGEQPKADDVVTVNYAGRLINGKEFDSSYKRGEPATFPVNGVIPGWVEALQMMKVGSIWELYIPASLAYGEQGAPPSIGPNETLIFKVELLGVKKS